MAPIWVLHVDSELSGTQRVICLATDSGIVGVGRLASIAVYQDWWEVTGSTILGDVRPAAHG